MPQAACRPVSSPVSKAVGTDTKLAGAQKCRKGSYFNHHDSKRQATGPRIARDDAELASVLSYDCDGSEENVELDSGSLSEEMYALPRKQLSQDGTWHVIRYPDQIGSELTCSNLSQGDEVQVEKAEEISYADCLPRRTIPSRSAGPRSPADNDHQYTEPAKEEGAMNCPQLHVKLHAERECQTSRFFGESQDLQQKDGSQQEAVPNAHCHKPKGIVDRGCQASYQPAQLPARSCQSVGTECQPAVHSESSKLSTDQSWRRAAVQAASPTGKPSNKEEGRQQRQAHVQGVEHSMQRYLADGKLGSADVSGRQSRSEKGTNTSPLGLLAAQERLQANQAPAELIGRLHEDSRIARPAEKALPPPLQSSANAARRRRSLLGRSIDFVHLIGLK